MGFEKFFGSSLILNILFIVAALIAIGDILATLFTILYQKYWYNKKMRPRYGEKFTPKCSIIVPCKGIPKDFGKNLEGFLELEYPEFEVIYVVESEQDTAVPTIKQIVDRSKNAQLVIAGLSTTCAQKNHNLLEALKRTSKPDVFVFADSDIRPGKLWLQELILPLADPKVAASSGFRWLHASKGSVGELTHSYVNVFMYVLFVVACCAGGVGLWGGSMAIRREDFEKLGVAQKWGKAGVDDMSLSQIVKKNARKAVLVPQCITHTDDLLQTVNGTIQWFERQIMFLKAHFKALWFFAAFPIASCAFALLISMPFALVMSLSPNHTFLGTGGGAALVFYIGELLAVLLYPFLGAMPKFHKFLLLLPMMRMTHIISYYKTMLTNTITWAGIRYKINFSGEVAKIERPQS